MSEPLPGPSTTASDLLTELSTLTTEQVSDDLRDLDTLSTSQLVQTMNRWDHDVPRAVERVLPEIAAAIDGVTQRLADGGRLVYLGAGTPGRLGILDASECPPTFNTDPGMVVGLIAGGDGAIRTAVENAEDDPVAAVNDLESLSLTARDVVVGISASGRTPYVVGGLRHAQALGALTVAVACNSPSAIGDAADHAIEVVVGPEIVAGSTRLRAATAQKLVLNMISTITMVKLGKTFGNVMVDLRATNEKLRARSRRAVMLITGADETQAQHTLQLAAGSVKVAVVMLLTGLEASDAHHAVEREPSLRRALASVSSDRRR
ncbi:MULTISPECIES: N-acetylmuramic acid 6-phosphate etherase [unclassified Microbacterium]|uniref:N-acetylmuramic acid 6-phosphate etherase n=1 Tax=unclassified Microbacterium TaxID=2609290 RepID=UPI0030176B2B